MTGTSLRPGARRLLTLLSTAGVRVVVWSAGGSAYAKDRCERHHLTSFIDAYHDKVRVGVGEPWVLDEIPLLDRPWVCLDDQPEHCPHTTQVIAVRPYISPDPRDVGLDHALDAAKAWLDSRPTPLGLGSLPTAARLLDD